MPRNNSHGQEMESLVTSPVEMGVASLPLQVQSICGDMHVCKIVSHGVVVAALDGIGHRDDAADASKIACATLEAYAKEPLILTVRYCHERLRSTRGVVMSVASFDVRHNL